MTFHPDLQLEESLRASLTTANGARCVAPLDAANAALSDMQELVAVVAREDRDGALRLAERTIANLDTLLHDYGIELGEVLPRKRCTDCLSDVVDYRMLAGDGGKREVVCVSCAIGRSAEAREHARADASGVLARVAQVVKARGATYGDPSASFARVAALWTPILEPTCAITPAKVALCMIALKVARLIESPTHRDSWDDVAGYADCGDRVSSPTCEGK